MRIAPRPEAVAVRMKVGVPLALDDLSQRLLDKSVRHRRYAQESFSSVWLGDFYAPHGRWSVRPRYQLHAHAGPVRFEVSTEFIYGHAVHTRCAFVAPDLRQGPFEILGVENLGHQG